MLFMDFVKKLFADPNEPKEKTLKGCQVSIPETVFFQKDGKIDFLTMLDRDCCLAQDIKTKMEPVMVRTKISDSVRERKKDSEMHGRQKAISQRA